MTIMNARHYQPRPARTPAKRWLLVFLLVAGTGTGCVRTTSIGRALVATDARADGDGAADRDATPAADAGADVLVDMGPIIGGGHDGPADAPDGN